MELLPVCHFVPNVSDKLQQVIERAVQRDPDRRFNSAKQMREALREAVPHDQKAIRTLLASVVTSQA